MIVSKDGMAKLEDPVVTPSARSISALWLSDQDLTALAFTSAAFVPVNESTLHSEHDARKDSN